MSAASEEVVSPGQAAQSDEELLARVQKKDYDAVGVLFDRYARLFLGIAFRILRDRGEAEDMVQEIFLRLCQKSNSFNPTKGSARTWMVQFAYRRSFDRRSYLTRRFFYGGTEIERLKNTLQEATGLEEQIAARLTGGQLRAAFEELNDKKQRRCSSSFSRAASCGKWPSAWATPSVTHGTTITGASNGCEGRPSRSRCRKKSHDDRSPNRVCVFRRVRGTLRAIDDRRIDARGMRAA